MDGSRFRYSPDYVARIHRAEARDYLVDHGIPAVDSFFEGEESESDPVRRFDGATFLRIGRGDDPHGCYGVDCENGAVYYLILDAGFLVNSSPRQFAESLQAYMDVTQDDSIAGDDELVESTLRSTLAGIDEAAVDDAQDTYWNDVLSDVSMGVYGDDDE